jgi:hypothetical protein
LEFDREPVAAKILSSGSSSIATSKRIKNEIAWFSKELNEEFREANWHTRRMGRQTMISTVPLIDKLEKCSKLATIGQAPSAVIQVKLHEYSDSQLRPLDLSSRGLFSSAFWHLSVVQPGKNRYNLPT